LNGDLLICKNGNVGASLNNFLIAERLLDVYTDPTRAVSKELYESIDSNLIRVAELVNKKD
jgi:hypothetical protein